MQDELNRFTGAWFRASWFWFGHAVLSLIIAALLPLAGTLVCIVCATASIMLAIYGNDLADRLNLP